MYFTLVLIYSISAVLPISCAAVANIVASNGTHVFILTRDDDTSDVFLKVLNIIGGFFVIISALSYLDVLDTNFVLKFMLIYFYPTTSALLNHMKFKETKKRTFQSWISEQNLTVITLNLFLIILSVVYVPLWQIFKLAQQGCIKYYEKVFTYKKRSKETNENINEESSIWFDQAEETDSKTSSSSESIIPYIPSIDDNISISGTMAMFEKSSTVANNRLEELRVLGNYFSNIKSLLMFLKHNYITFYVYYLTHSQCKKCNPRLRSLDESDNLNLYHTFKHLKYKKRTRFNFRTFLIEYIYFALSLLTETLKKNHEMFNSNSVTRVQFVSDIKTMQNSKCSLVFFDALHFACYKVTKNHYLLLIFLEDVVVKQQLFYRSGSLNTNFSELVYKTNITSARTKCLASGDKFIFKLSKLLQENSDPSMQRIITKLRSFRIRRQMSLQPGEYQALYKYHIRLDQCILSLNKVTSNEIELLNMNKVFSKLIDDFFKKIVFFKEFEWDLITQDFGGYSWLTLLKTEPHISELFYENGPTIQAKKFKIQLVDSLAHKSFHQRKSFLSIPVVYNKIHIRMLKNFSSVGLFYYMFSTKNFNIDDSEIFAEHESSSQLILD